jgi:glycosyltransferase involved in cell wall biosynthesis
MNTSTEPRILHVIASDQVRGAELFASDLVRSLASRGLDQRIALLRRSPGPRVQFEAPVAVVGAGRRQVPGLHVWPQAIVSLRRLVDGWRPSVIQAHGGEAFKYAVLAAAGRPTRIVYRRIGAAPSWITRGPRRIAYAALFRRAACIVAVAEAVRRETVHIFRVSNVVTIPNAVDGRRMHTQKGGEATRRLIGIDLSARVLLSLGALTWEKDPLMHLEVGARLVREDPHVFHVIVGDGPMKEEMHQAIRRRGLEPRIMMLGSRTDIPDLLAASDVLLVASRPDGMEGMPAVVIEAGMMGVPVAGYDIVGVSEVVVNNATGVLSSYGDVESLSANALRLFRDSEVRHSLGKEAQARCRSLFDIEVVASQYLALYQKVVDRDERAARVHP